VPPRRGGSRGVTRVTSHPLPLGGSLFHVIIEIIHTLKQFIHF